VAWQLLNRGNAAVIEAANRKLILLPGLDGTGVLFRPLLRVLPQPIEPVVISYPTREPLSYDELFSYVTERLPNEPFVLLGESFGGPLSLRIATGEFAHRVRGVILAGSFVKCPYDFVPRWAGALVPPLPLSALPALAKIKSWLGMYATEEHYSLSAEALSMVSANVFAHRVREIVRVDVIEQLLACRAPLLYMQGARDRVVWPGNLSLIQRLRPDVRVARIDAGHMILKTRPDAAALVIAEFVAANNA
jgi:pimeloyl-ACP methyl ester carboxylesterase